MHVSHFDLSAVFSTCSSPAPSIAIHRHPTPSNAIQRHPVTIVGRLSSSQRLTWWIVFVPSSFITDGGKSYTYLRSVRLYLTSFSPSLFTISDATTTSLPHPYSHLYPTEEVWLVLEENVKWPQELHSKALGKSFKWDERDSIPQMLILMWLNVTEVDSNVTYLT